MVTNIMNELDNSYWTLKRNEVVGLLKAIIYQSLKAALKAIEEWNINWNKINNNMKKEGKINWSHTNLKRKT